MGDDDIIESITEIDPPPPKAAESFDPVSDEKLDRTEATDRFVAIIAIFLPVILALVVFIYHCFTHRKSDKVLEYPPCSDDNIDAENPSYESEIAASENGEPPIAIENHELT